MKAGIEICPASGATLNSAIECEQQAFKRERICASFPADRQEGLLDWMRRWSKYLLETDYSFVALAEDKKTVLAFSMNELFPSPSPFVDRNPDPAAPVIEVLETLEAELKGLVSGDLREKSKKRKRKEHTQLCFAASLNAEFHIRHNEAALAARMKEGTQAGKLPVLHVGQIGCLADPRRLVASFMICQRLGCFYLVKCRLGQSDGAGCLASSERAGREVRLCRDLWATIYCPVSRARRAHYADFVFEQVLIA